MNYNILTTFNEVKVVRDFVCWPRRNGVRTRNTNDPFRRIHCDVE